MERSNTCHRHSEHNKYCRCLCPFNLLACWNVRRGLPVGPSARRIRARQTAAPDHGEEWQARGGFGFRTRIRLTACPRSTAWETDSLKERQGNQYGTPSQAKWGQSDFWQTRRQYQSWPPVLADENGDGWFTRLLAAAFGSGSSWFEQRNTASDGIDPLRLHLVWSDICWQNQEAEGKFLPGHETGWRVRE